MAGSGGARKQVEELPADLFDAVRQVFHVRRDFVHWVGCRRGDAVTGPEKGAGKAAVLGHKQAQLAGV